MFYCFSTTYHLEPFGFNFLQLDYHYTPLPMYSALPSFWTYRCVNLPHSHPHCHNIIVNGMMNTTTFCWDWLRAGAHLTCTFCSNSAFISMPALKFTTTYIYFASPTCVTFSIPPLHALIDLLFMTGSLLYNTFYLPLPSPYLPTCATKDLKLTYYYLYITTTTTCWDFTRVHRAVAAHRILLGSVRSTPPPTRSGCFFTPPTCTVDFATSPLTPAATMRCCVNAAPPDPIYLPGAVHPRRPPPLFLRFPFFACFVFVHRCIGRFCDSGTRLLFALPPYLHLLFQFIALLLLPARSRFNSYYYSPSPGLL